MLVKTKAAFIAKLLNLAAQTAFRIGQSDVAMDVIQSTDEIQASIARLKA